MCRVYLHISWIEEAVRVTLKVSLLFAASTKVLTTSSFFGRSAMGIVFLNKTSISDSVVSVLLRATTRLH